MAAKSPITCHILDSQLGKPATNVAVSVSNVTNDTPNLMGTGVTDSDGRCINLLPPGRLAAGTYKVTFLTKPYFEATNRETFFPYVEIIFDLKNPEEHYHIPLLLSAFSYTTYRGS